MNGACAIVVGYDRTFLAFASLMGDRPVFLQELEAPLTLRNDDIVEYVREHGEALRAHIGAVEKGRGLKITKIFLQLPWSCVQSRSIAETMPLRARKKITPADIADAKKYVEDKFLEWDDRCLHNVVSAYGVEGLEYPAAPLGVLAKRIELRTLLVWAKDKLCRSLEDSFEAIDRSLSGCIAPQLGGLASVFDGPQKTQVVFDIDYLQTHCLASTSQGLRPPQSFDFGIKQIIESLAQHFSLDLDIAAELFERYVSFKEIPVHKEVTIKKEEGYVNVSAQSLNTFVKSYCLNRLKETAGLFIRELKPDDCTVSVIGRLGVKEGFFAFSKELFPCAFVMPQQPQARSSAFGCIRYGWARPYEAEPGKAQSLRQRLASAYKEYF